MPELNNDLAPSSAGGLLIFDGDCAFCTSSAHWAGERLPDDASIAAWQAIDIARYGLSERDVMTAAYWIDPTGGVHRGHLAAANAALAMGFPYQIAGIVGLVPPFRWVAAVMYRLIARYRHRLPGATESCRLTDTDHAG